MNKQQLANKIWASANKMRSKIEANEYKDYILGFIFYKFLSEEEERFLLSEGWEKEQLYTVDENNDEIVHYVQNNLGYFISYNNLFSTWINPNTDFGVINVTEAISAFNRLISDTHKKVFNGIFETLKNGLKQLGESDNARSKAISGLLQLIKDIPMDGRQGYDVLGFIYEYLISKFAANAGKKAGEFYTPHEVSVLMAEIVAHHLRHRDHIQIYDPTSGSGSLLITIGKAAAKYINNPDNIKYYAQEIKQNTYNLTRMNLVMRGIRPSNIITHNGDTLAPNGDWPYFDDSDTECANGPSYELVRMDAVVSNPPYSIEWSRPEDKEQDKRFADYGLAPKNKAEYAFLLHDLLHIKPDGIMAIVLPHGVLFRPGDEHDIRKALIEHNNIDAIIGLPADIFFGTQIATIIMVLRQKRTDSDILFIDASKYAGKEGNKKKLRSSDIKRIFDAVVSRPKQIEKFARLVSRDEIRQNDYDLNIPKYVDSSTAVEHYDLYASMFGGIPQKEIDLLSRWWAVMPHLRADLFSEDEYATCLVSDIATFVGTHADVAAFRATFDGALHDYDTYLAQELIQRMQEVNTAREIDVLAADLFDRLKHVPLIDHYDAFQKLDESWAQTASDIELVQQEGYEVLRQVEPNMVEKKGPDKETIEVEQGKRGRVFPFSLVQSTFLAAELQHIQDLKEQLQTIASATAEIIDEAIEKEINILNDDDTKIDNDLLNTKCKEALQGVDTPDIATWEEYLALSKKRDKLAFIASHDAAFFDGMEKSKDGTFKKSTVNSRIKELQAAFVFPDGSDEELIVCTVNLLLREKQTKDALKEASAKLEFHTIATIEALTDQQIDQLLRLKWIAPIISALEGLRDKEVSKLAASVAALVNKYATTFAQVESDITTTETQLAAMLSDLEGSETDMRAIDELKKMLGHGDE